MATEVGLHDGAIACVEQGKGSHQVGTSGEHLR